jgi:hypothetical protein
MFVDAHIGHFVARLFWWQARIDRSSGELFAESRNEENAAKLSPRHPQPFVDNLFTEIRVGALQRREIQQWRGLRPASFDYNEIPTSSCQSFCWKARQRFDVPFFCLRHAPPRP